MTRVGGLQDHMQAIPIRDYLVFIMFVPVEPSGEKKSTIVWSEAGAFYLLGSWPTALMLKLTRPTTPLVHCALFV